MVTQAEVEAAVDAILVAEAIAAQEKLSIRTYATLALEASERVRPRRDPTNVVRQRRHKAKRRNVTGSEGVPGNVTQAARPETANVTRLAPAIDNVTNDVTANVTGNVPGRLAEIIDTDELLVKLLDAAGGNVHSGAADTAPVAALLEQGCDLDLDVLPAVRDLLTDPIQPPLRRWSVPWLGEEIIRRRDARMALDRVTQAPAAARTAPVPRRAAERAAPPPPQRPIAENLP